MRVEPPFMEVVWEDAFSDPTADIHPDNALDSHKPTIMHTRGWILVDDGVGISVFNEFNPESGCYRGKTFIPRGMIVEVRPIKNKRPRKRKVPQPEPGVG